MVWEQRIGSHPLRGGSDGNGELVILSEITLILKVCEHFLIQAFELSCCLDALFPASDGVLVERYNPVELVVDLLRLPELEHGLEDADGHGLQRL